MEITKKQAKELQTLQWMKNEFIKESKRMLKLLEKQQDKVDRTIKKKVIRRKTSASIIRRSKR